MFKREDYMEKIRPFINKDLVKVLSGIHRSGKSTLLQLIQQELLAEGILETQICSINFENLARANSDMMTTYQELLDFGKTHPGKSYLFLDEIQELPGWEKMVNSLRVDMDCDLYVTGSNSKWLSGELATYLVKRYHIPICYTRCRTV